MMTKAMKALGRIYGMACEGANEHAVPYPTKDYNLVKQALEENKKLKAEIELVNDNYGQLRNETNREFAKLKAELEKYKISYEQLKKINKLKESE